MQQLQRLQEALFPLENRSNQKVAILHGLGGMGKTQLALQFARLHRNDFTAVFWISGETEETLKTGIVKIVERLKNKKIATGNKDEGEIATSAAYAWLNHPGNFRWLLIIDNVDSPLNIGNTPGLSADEEQREQTYNITHYLDRLNQGSIIITTRLAFLTQLGTGIHVDKFPLDEGTRILCNASGMKETIG